MPPLPPIAAELPSPLPPIADDLESKLELARKNREEAKAVQQQWGEEEAVLTERGRQERRKTEALEQTLLELTGEVDNYKDKLAYSENQASKNLKLYRVKQQEVELAQAKAAGLED